MYNSFDKYKHNRLVFIIIRVIYSYNILCILDLKVLMQDFMSLIASFSGKLYRLRGYDNQKKLLSKAGDYIEQKQQ